jgi:hypothetical protein
MGKTCCVGSSHGQFWSYISLVCQKKVLKRSFDSISAIVAIGDVSAMVLPQLEYSAKLEFIAWMTVLSYEGQGKYVFL